MDNLATPLDIVWPDAPGKETVLEVAPGLLWARLPLPFRLNHVNIWLVEEEGGWTVIDTGCKTPELLSIWEALENGPLRRLPILRVVATHGHVDHIGLAGWLVDRHKAEFVGTFAEWNWARVSHIHDVPGAAETHLAYLIRHGFDPETAGGMVKSRAGYIDLATPVPGAIVEIRDGGTIRMGKDEWDVIVTRGHAFEHASFFNSKSGIIIAGDHLLPKISPVIAVFETAPKGDPLGDYIASFEKFSHIAGDVLVLPSHGMPYRGIHNRIAQLRVHHRNRLEATLEFLATPKTGFELAKAMFPHVEGADDIGFALGETLAHVNYLLTRNMVTEIRDRDGKLSYLAQKKRNRLEI